jgi:hypothetical protein
VALILEMLEESADQTGVDLLQHQTGWLALKHCSRELEQELETLSIGIAGVSAGATLMDACFPQERFDEGSDGCHARFPSDMNASPAMAMSRTRSAVASRYH